MAITFVGASSIEVGSSVTLTPPAGYAEGDLLIIFAAVENNTPITDPAGWDGFSAFFTYIATKFASSSEAPVTVSLSTSTGKAVMLAYRGVEDIADGQIGIRFGTNMPSEIRYPAIENSLVFRSWTVPNNSSIITPPGSVDVRINSDSTSTHRGILLTDELQPVPGASALRTATQTVNGSFDTLIYVISPYIPPSPITFVGASSVQTGQSLTLNVPAGVVAGDTLIIILGTSIEPTFPAEWTSIISPFGGTFNMYAATKIATNSESAVELNGLSSDATAVMLAYRGVRPWLGSSGRGGIGTSMVSPTEGTFFENSRILRVWSCNSGGNTTLTASPLTTVRVNSSGTSNNIGLLVTDEVQPESGIVPARTSTLSDAREWRILVWAMGPADNIDYQLKINGVTISPGITIG